MIDKSMLVNAYDFFKDDDRTDLPLIDLMVKIACMLLLYRDEHNLTQKELADQMGVSQELLSMMESADYDEDNIELEEVKV